MDEASQESSHQGATGNRNGEKRRDPDHYGTVEKLDALGDSYGARSTIWEKMCLEKAVLSGLKE